MKLKRCNKPTKWSGMIIRCQKKKGHKDSLCKFKESDWSVSWFRMDGKPNRTVLSDDKGGK